MQKRENGNPGMAREQRRDQFTNGRGGATSTRKWVFGLAAGALVTAMYFAIGGLDAQSTPAKPVTATPGPASVTIPTSEIDSGQAKFYDYKAADNKTVRFFVMKSSDGVYRAALDTCDECYQAKKGYFQRGDDMVCRKCGRHFPSTKINEVSGGCNPVGLRRTVADGKVVIAASDLEAGKSYF
jgi:uncharacterized membrane protein